MKSQKHNKKALSWIYKNSKKYIPSIAVCTMLSAVTSVAFVVLAYVSSFVIDIATGKKQGNITFFIVMLFTLIAMQAVLNIVSSAFTVRVSGRLEMHLRHGLFSTLMKKEYGSISALHSGDILNRFTSDIDVIVSAVVGVVPGAVSFMARLVAAFIMLLSISRSLGLAVLVIGIAVAAAARVYSGFVKKIHKEVMAAQGDTRAFMQECTENIVVVKTFNSAESFGERLKGFMDRTYRLKIKRNFIANFSNSTKYILFTGGYYAALAFGAFLISGGGISYGTLTALLSIISHIRRPLTNMSGLLPQYYAALASAERIMEIEELPEEPQQETELDVARLYSGMQSIKFTDVGFSYDGKREILSHCNIDIKRGEMVALIGGSGEGKSTVFRMLLGLYRASYGSIKVEGDDRRNIDPTLRGLFAYVPQGNLILSGTIGENIRFCNADATDEEVEEAAKIADLYDFISALPEGFNTVVGERGQGLSEGQIQRISIARAILCGAPILLLDECTSALDEATEKRVLDNIKKAANKTAILISHRKAALEICDTVYSIENGTATKL